MTPDYNNNITIPLAKLGIYNNKLLTEFIIKLVAKEVFEHDEKQYIKILEKYGIY